MPRGPRHDEPGQIFHVMNRGTARRTMFEHTGDFRYFLSRLAYAVRRGELDALAHTLMPTHFHLIVRSHGHLSTAMRRIQSEYTRFFNRSRRRDGALQRGRFVSKPITTEVYLVNAVPYVEENPVQARIVAAPEEWPWGSAGARARGRHRSWLSDELAHLGSYELDPASRDVRQEFVEARLAGRDGESQFESVLNAAPLRVADWMRRKAQLADGTSPGAPIAGVNTVLVQVRRTTKNDESIQVPGGYQHGTALLLKAGLLRDLASCSFARVARLLNTTDARAKRLYQYHLRCLEHEPDYCTRSARVVTACLTPLAVPRNR